MILIEYLTLTEWYHYVLLFLWLVMLAIGIKYFHLIESHFKPKNEFSKGEVYGKILLSISFIIGLFMFLAWMFKPPQVDAHSDINWNYIEYGFYGLFLFLLIINAAISIKNYTSKSGIIRLIIMSIFMLVYFYSGMLGGLMVVATFTLFIIIFALIKLKKTLTIR